MPSYDNSDSDFFYIPIKVHRFADDCYLITLCPTELSHNGLEKPKTFSVNELTFYAIAEMMIKKVRHLDAFGTFLNIITKYEAYQLVTGITRIQLMNGVPRLFKLIMSAYYRPGGIMYKEAERDFEEHLAKRRKITEP